MPCCVSHGTSAAPWAIPPLPAARPKAGPPNAGAKRQALPAGSNPSRTFAEPLNPKFNVRCGWAAMDDTDDLEWDSAKDAANRRKHGLQLKFARLILADPNRLVAPTRLAVSGELRQLAVGTAGELVLSCVFVTDGAKRRIISVGPASRKERRAYEAQADSRRTRG
jgi:uncharacterized DUF497 family protein